MEEYREIEFLETKLRVYRNGDIWRFLKNSGPYGKKGDWKFIKSTQNNEGYLICQLNKKGIKCHRIVAYAYLGLDINNKKEIIDHKNRITTDNRVENLHIVDNQKNSFNTNAKGCSFHKQKKKWGAEIKVNYKSIHLGYFDTEEEAHQAYLNAKLIHHII
jgi:hypothetical protein